MFKPVHRISGFLRHLCLHPQGVLGPKLRQCSFVSQLVLSSAANGDAGSIPARLPSWKACEGVKMDDFMLWPAEDSKLGVGALASSAKETNTIVRQNNLSTSASLNSRTVDDVWMDIQKQSTADASEPDQNHQQQQRQARQQFSHNKQATFGEMTLEDFLVRNGVGTDDPDAGSQTAESSSFHPSVSAASIANGFSTAVDALPSLQQDWINFRQQPLQHQQLLQHAEAVAAAKRSFQTPSLVMSAGSPLYDGLGDNAALGPDGFTNTLALSPAFPDYSLPHRKRFSSEIVAEKTIERRQKRMIKNRESAARSRARKQAYTVELEAEVTLLKEENAKLKQQQALQIRLPELTSMQNSKIRVLRRTQSI